MYLGADQAPSPADPERSPAEIAVAVLIDLGKILIEGMERVNAADRFTGQGVVRNVYKTHFPMPDGREWELTFQPREAPRGRRTSI